MIDRALRLTREFHRMKQGELARKLDISTSYLSEIEHGKKAASLELLEKYSRVFSVPASTFLLFKERMDGRQDKKTDEHARRLLDFFDWVASDEEDNRAGEKEAPTAAREAEKAIRTT